MQLTRLPPAHLQRFIKLLWASSPDDAAGERQGAREHVLPTGGMHLVLRLSGPPLRLFGGSDDVRGQTCGYAIVGGARAVSYMRDVSVATRSVGAQLQPGAARALLGAPEDTLAGRHTPLDALWGARQTDAALEQVHAAGGLGRQLAVFEALLAERVAEAPGAGLRGLHPAIAQALGPLARENTSIGGLVARSGYSHRRFIALFRGVTGLSPKAYARVMRLDRVLTLATDPARHWAEIALTAGYSDQAHLSREFSAMAGISPQAWRQTGATSPRHVPAGAAGQIRSRR